MSDLAKRLFRSFRAHQRLAQFIGSAYGTELNTTEGSILIELEGDPTLSVVSLAEILQLNKATISRSIQRLVEERYLAVRESVLDARRRDLRIVKRGHDFLEVHHKQTGELALTLEKNLKSQREVNELALLMKRFADADGAPPSSGAPSVEKNRVEMPVMVEMWRLASSHSITSKSFLESGHPSTTWQLLSCLAYDPPPHKPTAIAKQLCMRGNTVSQTLKRFDQLGWVSNHKLQDDGRTRGIKLLEKGNKVLEQIELVGVNRMERCLGALKPEEQRTLVELFERYVGLGALKADIRRAKTESERQYYRGFLVEEAVRSRLHFKLPPQICAPDSLLFALWDEAVCLAVIEITQKHPEIVWIAAVRESLHSARFSSFFIEVAKVTGSLRITPIVRELLPPQLEKIAAKGIIAPELLTDLEKDAVIAQLQDS